MILLILIVIVVFPGIKALSDIPTEIKINKNIDKQINKNAEWTKRYFNDKYGEGTIK